MNTASEKTKGAISSTINPTVQKIFITVVAATYLFQFASSSWQFFQSDGTEFRYQITFLLFYLTPMVYFLGTYALNPAKALLQRCFESMVLATMMVAVVATFQQILIMTSLPRNGSSYTRWEWLTEGFVALIYFFTLAYARFTKRWK